MAKHREEDFVLPALKVLKKYGPSLMSTIKEKIDEFIVLTPEDLIHSTSRSEEKYKQIVGNLTSHNNKTFFKYVDADIVSGDENKKSAKSIFRLNNDGERLLSSIEFMNYEEMIEDFEYENSIENVVELNEQNLHNLDNREVEEGNGISKNYRPKTEPQIAKTVLIKEQYLCRYGRLIGTKHITFNAKVGHPYVEAHHLIPLKAYRDFKPINLDRSDNIVPLCPICHAQVHHGTLEEKVKILRVLYDDAIAKLNKAGINISFEDLINKYYK